MPATPLAHALLKAQQQADAKTRQPKPSRCSPSSDRVLLNTYAQWNGRPQVAAFE